MAASVSTGNSSQPSVANRRIQLATADITSPPRSPQTPLLGRSISSQYGSPSSYRPEQEDVLVYVLDARQLSAGFAGESRPRCIIPFHPDIGRRIGDYRHYEPEYSNRTQRRIQGSLNTSEYELYRNDIGNLDLALVEDKLDRALRIAQVDYLQVDAKPRRAILAVPSMLPTPLLEIALKVLFGHFTQPPSIAVLTNPVLCCVSAGLRNALVVDIGWEETVITAVGEYKEILQRRSVRAGKLLAQEMATMMEDVGRAQEDESRPHVPATLGDIEELISRMAWCQPNPDLAFTEDEATPIQAALGSGESVMRATLPFARFAEPAENALFAPQKALTDHDDHDLPLHLLAYRTLVSLPLDLRSLCVSRIVITGRVSELPGLKRRLLYELTQLARKYEWDPVRSYGSASAKRHAALQERSANIRQMTDWPDENLAGVTFSPTKLPMQEKIAHSDRVHDDVQDPLTLRVERGSLRARASEASGAVKGVNTLGAWAGASLIASLRVKGAHEIEREDFLKHGLRDGLRAI